MGFVIPAYLTMALRITKPISLILLPPLKSLSVDKQKFVIRVLTFRFDCSYSPLASPWSPVSTFFQGSRLEKEFQISKNSSEPATKHTII